MSITSTALCKALCLLWCRKLDIPLYAKPIMLEAMPPIMEANIAPRLCLWSVGNLGSISLYHLPMCHRLCDYSIVFVFGKVMHTV